MPINDIDLFKEEVKDIKKIKSNKAEIGKANVDNNLYISRKKNAITKNNDTINYDISDTFITDCYPEEFLSWCCNGVQRNQLNKLKLGHYYFEETLDLHGFNINKSRNLLFNFISYSLKKKYKCIRVIHGKNSNLHNKRSTIKSFVNYWLKQHNQIIAFTSATPKHGGNGALYVLLRI